MGDHDDALKPPLSDPAPGMTGDDLLRRYGDELAGEEMTEAQKRALLLALYRIMQAFVDLGFSVRPGENFSEKTGLGMDDVLDYLIPEDTAHETVAPKNTNNKEQR